MEVLNIVCCVRAIADVMTLPTIKHPSTFSVRWPSHTHSHTYTHTHTQFTEPFVTFFNSFLMWKERKKEIKEKSTFKLFLRKSPQNWYDTLTNDQKYQTKDNFFSNSNIIWYSFESITIHSSLFSNCLKMYWKLRELLCSYTKTILSLF
jgi:hypothetical protein